MRFVITEHAVAVLHPRVRGEATVAHPNAHTDAASGDAVSLQHPVERDGADEAERPKDAEFRGASHGQRKRLGAAEHRRGQPICRRWGGAD